MGLREQMARARRGRAAQQRGDAEQLEQLRRERDSYRNALLGIIWAYEGLPNWRASQARDVLDEGLAAAQEWLSKVQP